MSLKELSILSLAMALTGCSMAPAIDDTLIRADDPALQLVERDKASIAWQNPSTALARHHDKVVYLDLPKPGSFDGAVQLEGDQLVRHFRSQLEGQLSAAGYRVLERPAPGALTLRVSVADLQRKPRDPSVMEYIPIGFLVGLSLHATGIRDETLYLFVQSELSDGPGGASLLQAVDRASGRDIDPSASPKVDDLYPALDTAARQIRERLDRALPLKAPA
ncbi:DUF3313 domain-containing protein [Metapseudomonas resinovorans]|uniref:DUF3313 domain-containing protein n=1 Tax=Metapseudomonas resinovorans NBRC 106553 TaxID=1245471 RepID=S6AYH1_METRE|nr:DUF3313 domain-containing protein [Pseudomonas resinovorans]BAN49811.1 hypothetical protein PCA10_40790 [Pseudomonas resinovorans NBRC 106553]